MLGTAATARAPSPRVCDDGKRLLVDDDGEKAIGARSKRSDGALIFPENSFFVSGEKSK